MSLDEETLSIAEKLGKRAAEHLWRQSEAAFIHRLKTWPIADESRRDELVADLTQLEQELGYKDGKVIGDPIGPKNKPGSLRIL